MFYVTFDEYMALGYSAVPIEQFTRWEMRAESVVRKHTFNRITSADLRPPDSANDETKRIATMNQMGVCELIDAFFAHSEQTKAVYGDAGAPISSFSNEGYSESYANSSSTDSTQAINAKIGEIIGAYFTQEQLYRGV